MTGCAPEVRFDTDENSFLPSAPSAIKFAAHIFVDPVLAADGFVDHGFVDHGFIDHGFATDVVAPGSTWPLRSSSSLLETVRMLARTY